MTTIKVQFSTNRNYVGGLDIFGSEVRGNTEYVNGSVDVVRYGGQWRIDVGTIIIGPPIRPGSGKFVDENGISAYARKLSGPGSSSKRKSAPGRGLVFIHGFNTDFREAIEDTARLAHLYEVSGAYCVSWPALHVEKISIDHYRADKRKATASAQFALSALRELLTFLVSRKKAELPILQIVAHSMGNYVLGQAVQRINAKNSNIVKSDLFEGAILIAADEADNALSRGKPLAPLLKLAKKVAVYYYGSDWALTASRIVNKGWAPLGIWGPRDLANLPGQITSIDCSRVALENAEDDTGHGYLRTAPKVIADIRQVLAGDAPDDIQPRLQNYVDPVPGRAWFIPRM